MVGGFHGVPLPSAKHSRSSDGKTPYERRFGMPFDGPVIPFGAMVEYNHISAKEQVLPGVFLGYALYAERIWKGDIVVVDIE